MCVLAGLVMAPALSSVVCLGKLVSLRSAEVKQAVADIACTWPWELTSCFLTCAAKFTSRLCRGGVLCVMMQCVCQWSCTTFSSGNVPLSCGRPWKNPAAFLLPVLNVFLECRQHHRLPASLQVILFYTLSLLAHDGGALGLGVQKKLRQEYLFIKS